MVLQVRLVVREVIAIHKMVKKRMLTFTVKLQRILGTSSLGDKEEEEIFIPGYLVENMTVASYDLGKEIMSSAQVYLLGTDMNKIDANDTVSVGTMKNNIFVPIVKDKQILRRDNYYKPNNQADVGVLYLS